MSSARKPAALSHRRRHHHRGCGLHVPDDVVWEEPDTLPTAGVIRDRECGGHLLRDPACNA